MKLPLLLAVAALASAQPAYRACQAPPDLASFYSQLKRDPDRRPEFLRARLASDPDNLFLTRWLLEDPELRPGAMADEYSHKLETHPGEPLYIYFSALSLLGADTPRAVSQLRRALDLDSAFPWPWIALMSVYATPNFKDSAQLGQAMLHFSALCPEAVDAYDLINSVQDRATLRELAARFRRAVEDHQTAEIAAYYAKLWAAEFRAADPAEFESLRRRVSAELDHVRELDPANLRALASGYRLIGDTAKAKELEAKVPRASAGRPADQAINTWFDAHPNLPPDATQEQRDARRHDQFLAAFDWVARWPLSSYAWYWRLSTLNRDDDTGIEDIEIAGDALLAALAHERGWSGHPRILDLASIWSSRDIRLPDCVRLAREAIADVDRGPWSDDDRRRGSESLTSMAPMLDQTRFEAYRIIAEASTKLQDFPQARSALAQMKSYVDTHPDSAFRESLYLGAAGRLAEAEGRNLDALAWYQCSLLRFRFAPVKDRAQALWRALGGTPEAFDLWTSTPSSKATVAATSANAWTTLDRPLTDLNAPDLSGKTWTVANLQGRTTFINVWATWCEPCREELPQLQKLYEQVKGRKDAQVISISIDANPGLIGPFLAENHYTFPVLLAAPLVDRIAPEVSIPRNWIVDRAGTLRLEWIGFDRRAADWLQRMLERLAAIQ